jgi:hypothetical protein
LKENWLCENTVISILDYVECFMYKLTSACEIEQDNLKQNEDKMKQWYDKDAMIRAFKSGEKVIVLLLIRCHPLQATYCWRFVIESRLNDFNLYCEYTYDRKEKTNMSGDNTRLLERI